jgi:hypothetical protein
VSAAAHKGIIASKLSDAGLDADIDPVWNVLRPLCSSDTECEARVLLSLFGNEIRAIRERLAARPPTIEAAVATSLLATYDASVQLATGDLQRATAGSGLTSTRTRRADECDYDGEYHRPYRTHDGGWWSE